MWSSCPWVRTTASMSSSRCSMTPKSGRIRSTPGCSASGNRTPQSMTSSRPSNSSTAMLRPISPRPPSAMTRRPPSGSGGGALQVEVRLGDADATVTARCRRRRGRMRSCAICSGVASTSGGRTGPAGSPSSSQRRLDHDGALAAAHHAGVDRQQALVDRAGLDQVAGLDRGDQLGQPGADDVPDDADHADGAEREQRQVQDVVAAVVGEVGAGQGPGDGAEVALGVLDRDDPRVLREPDQRLDLDRARLRARRDVVEHHRQVGGVGDRGEVPEQAGLRGPVVVRRDDEQAVHAEPLGRRGRSRSSARCRWCRRRRSRSARSPTASSTASRTACCSPSLIVGDSPVVPRTTRPSWACRSTRCAASSCAPARSIEPSSASGVTIAVSTRPNGRAGSVVMRRIYSARAGRRPALYSLHRVPQSRASTPTSPSSGVRVTRRHPAPIAGAQVSPVDQRVDLGDDQPVGVRQEGRVDGRRRR